MTIPVNQIVQVLPGVLAAAGSAVDLNGLGVSQSTELPNGQLVGFANTAAVGAYFGLSSTEYQFALVYFTGTDQATRTPGLLYFARYNSVAAAAFLRGGSMANVSLTQLQAMSGTLTISSGGTPVTSSSISLTAATSFSNAATIIQAGFSSPPFTVSWDVQQSAFVFTNTATGATSTIGFATGTLAASLKLDAADGAVVSPGAAIDTPAAAMPRIRALGQNWSSFTTMWQPIIADMVAFGTWAGQQQDQVVYALYDNDPNALTVGSTTTAVAQLNAANVDGTIPMYGNITHAAFVMAWMASLNFSVPNGRRTLAFQSQSGIVASVNDATSAVTLRENGYNYYGAYATAKQGFTFAYNGQITGKFDWADTYVNQIWLNASLQLALITLLTNAGSIPYNAAGNAMIEASIIDPANAAVNFGAIRTGVQLAASQLQQLYNAIGTDVSQALNVRGWYLQIQQADAATRVSRGSPPMTFWYCDGGSVQALTLSSIVIQ